MCKLISYLVIFPACHRCVKARCVKAKRAVIRAVFFASWCPVKYMYIVKISNILSGLYNIGFRLNVLPLLYSTISLINV